MTAWTEIVIDPSSPFAKRRGERRSGDIAPPAVEPFDRLLGEHVRSDSWRAAMAEVDLEILAFAPAQGVLAVTWRLESAAEGEALACSLYLAGTDAGADADAVRYYQAEIVAPLATALRVGPVRDLLDEAARPLLCTTIIPPRRLPDRREMEARKIVAVVESRMAAAYFRRALGA